MENIKLKNSALLLIEFQKTWTEKGIFHKLIKKEYEKRNVLDNTIKTAEFFRELNIPVIQAPLILDKSDKNRYKQTPFLARLLKQFTINTSKAEFTEGIYKKDDISVTGRYSYDAFKGSNLEEILKENQIETVFVAGFTTDHCVKETMVSLQEKGYKSVMLSDCTATGNAKLQMKTESEFETILSSEIINTEK